MKNSLLRGSLRLAANGKLFAIVILTLSTAIIAPADNEIAPARFTVPPNASSVIAMRVLPQATCVLHPDVSGAEEWSVKLFADDDGIVRIHVTPLQESDQTARFQIGCEANSLSGSYSLELRASPSPTEDFP